VHDLPLTADDRLRVMRATRDQPPREQLLAELVIGHGVRLEHALAARAEDIAWGAEQVRVTIPCDRGARRTLTVERDRVEAVLGARREGPVFATASGVPIRADYAQRVLWRLTDAAGVPRAIAARRLRSRRAAAVR
jgi:integrase